MGNLISPGVSVTIIDESFFIPGRVTTLPVIFIATEDEKTQPDGITPALGTYEHGIYREVTSISESLQLYGIPRYIESADGEPFHGDARNEYGLDALNKFLEIGNRAYVVRANVNLNDDIEDLRELFSKKIDESCDYFDELFEDYLEEYNLDQGLTGTNQEDEVFGSDVKLLLEEALQDLFDSYSFSSKGRTGDNNLFKEFFITDHTSARAGYQEVIFDTSGGFLTRTDVTGVLNDTTTYGATITFDGVSAVTISLDGSDIQTFGELIDQINTVLGANGSIDFNAGRLRVTSSSTGVTSSVSIEEDISGAQGLFSSLNLFSSFADPVSGEGPNPLPMYPDGYSEDAIGAFNGLYNAIDDSVKYTSTEVCSILTTASNEYELTVEFRNYTSLGANNDERNDEIVERLQAAVNNPDLGLRNVDAFNYNLLVCPGYPEVTDELVRLAQDMLEEVFVIGETPFDKPPSGLDSITIWADSNGRVTYTGAAYWYAHGLSSNIDGKDILTSSASTALRVIAYNDRVAQLWYAPAGVNRGTCPHLTSTGYVSGTLGTPTTFVEEDLDQGKRDSLYEFPKNINPIARISGRGILVMGQKTVAPAVSSRESINVERLLRYIKREIRRGVFPYLFEPNDQITRDQVKATVDAFLNGLLNTRGLQDFATLCDDTNNTPDRVQRKELWIDIAVKPTLAVEFIYAPIKVVLQSADVTDFSGIEATPENQ
jgi:hypothetical protein